MSRQNPLPASTSSPVSVFKARLGAAIQKQRLTRGLTQRQLASFARLSLKYVGEIERGEANTTLDAVARIAVALDWDPMEPLEGSREPITEGVRVHLLKEIRQMRDRLGTMEAWLEAIDPAMHPEARARRLMPTSVAMPAPMSDESQAALTPAQGRPHGRRERRGKVDAKSTKRRSASLRAKTEPR